MSEQPLPDLAAREAVLAIFSRAAQDTQDVKLRRAEAVRPKKLGDLVAEGEGQTLKAQVDFVLEAGECGFWAGPSGGQKKTPLLKFVVTIFVLTSFVK